MTGTAGASNPQVRNQIRLSPQVAKSAPRTLSRWRHGFKSRWDYQQTRRSEPLSGAGEPSRSILVPHLSRGGPRRVTCPYIVDPDHGRLRQSRFATPNANDRRVIRLLE